MKELIEEIKRDIPVNEDWRKTALALGTSAALTLGGANVTQANASLHHHKQHHHTMSVHNYSEQDIIKAIAGEAGTYEGMLAVADVIRNRYKLPGEYKHNVLKGVAGLHAKFLAHESPKRFELAKKAWLDSETKNIMGNSYLWGNDNDVNNVWKNDPKFDFSKLEFVKKVEGNNFYRYKR